MRDVSLSDQRFDDDLPEERAASPKRRAAGPPPAWAPKKPPTRGGMFGKRRLGVMTLVGIGGLALVGVPLNALFFQDGRHPAPLFATHFVTPEKGPVAETPTPPARPAKIESAAHEVEATKAEATARTAPKSSGKAEPGKADPLAALLKTEAPPAAVKPEKKREMASRDQIGALLGDARKPAPAPAQAEAAAAPSAPDRAVLSTQRALQRLGYVVRPDGLMSASLRKTIEKFERDNGLPATGELTPKVVKAIAARASAGRQQ